MSKQTLKRQTRRSIRKQAQQRRELFAASKREGWLQENLGQALKALARMQGKTSKDPDLTPADVRRDSGESSPISTISGEAYATAAG